MSFRSGARALGLCLSLLAPIAALALSPAAAVAGTAASPAPSGAPEPMSALDTAAAMTAPMHLFLSAGLTTENKATLALSLTDDRLPGLALSLGEREPLGGNIAREWILSAAYTWKLR